MSNFKFIPNPYIVGNPIKTGDMFYGRESDFEFLQRKLDKASESYIAVLCGERRSGKTSILFQVLNGRLGPGFMPILIDMQTMAGLQNEAEFFEKVSKEIFKNISSPQIKPGDFDFISPQSNPYRTFDALIDQINSAFPKKNLIFLIDEYELIDAKIDEGSLKINFIHYLAGLLESGRRISIVMTGSDRLEQRKGDHWGALFAKALYRNVSYLTKEDTMRLVTEPVKGKLEFSKSVLKKVYRLTAGQPFYTQVVCQNMVDYANEHQLTAIDDKAYDLVVADILENPLPQMIYFWNSLSNNKKLILALLAEVLEDEHDAVHPDFIRKTSRRQESEFGFHASLQSIITTLEGLYQDEVVKKEDDLYCFQVDLFRLWIKRDHSIWRVMKEVGKDMADDIRTTMRMSTSSSDSSSSISTTGIPQQVGGSNMKWLGIGGAAILLAGLLYFFWPAGGDDMQPDNPSLTENPVDNPPLQSTTDPQTDPGANSGGGDEQASSSPIEEPDPPQTDTNGETNSQLAQQAITASSRMTSAKTSARRANATGERSYNTGLRNERAAKQKLNEEDFSGAIALFDRAAGNFRSAENAKQQSDRAAQQAGVVAAKSLADRARVAMKAIKDQASSISDEKAGRIAAQAKDKETEAEAHYRQKAYGKAESEFKDAQDLYQLALDSQSSDQQQDLAAVNQLQDQLNNLKSRLNSADHGSIPEYQQAQNQEGIARTQLAAGNIAAAENAFRQAISSYESAIQSHRRKGEAVANLLNSYRLAMEGENIRSMESLWTSMPKATKDGWVGFFRAARDLRVEMNTRSLDINSGSATANVNVRMTYSGPKGSGVWTPWRFDLQETAAGWRILNIDSN